MAINDLYNTFLAQEFISTLNLEAELYTRLVKTNLSYLLLEQ